MQPNPQKYSIQVSIHLYLQEALEYSSFSGCKLHQLSFNPFIPTRGVGIAGSYIIVRSDNWFQSIYTYKRRWNLLGAVLDTLPFIGFNPFIPTRGVGIPLLRCSKCLECKFQSIYTYKRRWNSHWECFY